MAAGSTEVATRQHELTGSREGVDVDVMKTALVREDRRVCRGILPDDLELDLGPRTDVIEAHLEPRSG